MNTRMRETLALVVVFILFITLPMGCGKSRGPSLQDIPPYPNATEGESMEYSGPGGFVGGKLAQFTTTDLFHDVVAFYTDALNRYKPNVFSHTSELGRQTVISIPQKKGTISVAIQELTEEGKVNITFMPVGS